MEGERSRLTMNLRPPLHELDRLRFHHLLRSPLLGDALKRQFNFGQIAELYFWRDSAGHEVDLLVPQGARFMPVEIKSGSTFSADWATGLRKLSVLFGALAGV